MNSETTNKKTGTKSIKVAVLPGDGIGPEVMAQAIEVLNAACQGIDLQFAQCLVGGAAIDATGKALPNETLETCSDSDAILFGSVGGQNGNRFRLMNSLNGPPSCRSANISVCSPICVRQFVSLS